MAAVDRAEVEKLLLEEFYNWFIMPYVFTAINRQTMYSKYVNATCHIGLTDEK
jgi:hypothetical protein